ncbi:hypothetical protein ATCC90586_007810 [Pythium insidiosum]|nr:hypothetical protein ATCC90586_007810 [Pythium insidiosum]
MRLRSAWNAGFLCALLAALDRTGAAGTADATGGGNAALQDLLRASAAAPPALALRTELLTPSSRDAFLQQLRDTVPDTVPEGVECKKVKRCDKRNVCAIICERGSVVVEPWLQHALALQRRLAYRRNFCHARLPGTHNSAINMADGYGIEDHVFQGYLQYFSWFKQGMEVHTNDQLFSLTDQLQMGVRFIELDVHWFDNDLRIAHCGGFHSSLLDNMISVFNQIAKWLGTNIEWDSQTIGCKPSLSSIPSSEQRPLKEALEELAKWLHAPENEKEFLLVFFDDETNLYKWKKVRTLISHLRDYFPDNEILLPSDLVKAKGWPSFEELLAVGKRVIFMSGSDYSPRGDDLLFVKDAICNWTEPSLPFEPYPECDFPRDRVGPLSHQEWILRPETSEIVYGFLNADGHLGDNTYILNETTIPPMAECGVNIPSPDNITPRRMEAMVWAVDKQQQLTPGKCVALKRGSAHWTSVDCEEDGIVALCAPKDRYSDWILTPATMKESAAKRACAELGPEMVYQAPTNGYENKLVAALLEQAGPTVKGVWIEAKDFVEAIYSRRSEAMNGGDAGVASRQHVDDILAIE